MAKAFSELSEREILALAISLEEDDARICGDYADRLKADLPRRVGNGGCATAFRLRRSGLRYAPVAESPVAPSSQRAGRNAEVLSDLVIAPPRGEVSRLIPKLG